MFISIYIYTQFFLIHYLIFRVNACCISQKLVLFRTAQVGSKLDGTRITNVTFVFPHLGDSKFLIFQLL